MLWKAFEKFPIFGVDYTFEHQVIILFLNNLLNKCY